MSFEDSFYIDSIRTVRAPNGLNRNEVRSKLINFSESFANETSNGALAIILNTASPAQIAAGTGRGIVTAEDLAAAGITPGGGGGGVETVTASIGTGNASIINSISTSTDIVLKTIGRSTQAINIDDGAASIVIGFNDDQVTSLGGVDSLTLQSVTGANVYIADVAGGGDIQLNPTGDLVLNSGHDFFMGGNFTNAGDASMNNATVSGNVNTNNIVAPINTDLILNTSGTGVVNFTNGMFVNGDINITNTTIKSAVSDGPIILQPDGIGFVSVSGTQIKNIAAPTDGTDATNKDYVDAVAQGFGPKLAVKCKTTNAQAADMINPTLISFTGSGQGKTITKQAPFAELVIDDVTVLGGLTDGDRILLAGSVASEHYGIYRIVDVGSAVSPWQIVRTSDADDTPSTGEVTIGIYTFVQEGTTHGYQGWALVFFAGAIDTDAQTWSAVTQAGSGITAITPVINGGAAGAFVTNGLLPTNTLTIDARLFNEIGSLSAASDIYFGSNSGANRNVHIRTNNSSILYLNDASAGAILIGSASTSQIQMFAGGPNIIQGGTVNINDNTGGTINIGTAGHNAAINISSGSSSGNVTIGNNGAHNKVITLIGGTAGGIGGVAINVGAGAAVTNIATGGTTGSLVLGGTSNNVIIKSGSTTGDVSILSSGGGTILQTINIGSSSSNTSGINTFIGTNNATGVIAIAQNSGSSSVEIGTGSTTGAVTIGGNGNAINIKNGSNAGGTINIGNNRTGAIISSINIGSSTNITTHSINIGTSAFNTITNINTGNTVGVVNIGNTSCAQIEMLCRPGNSITLNGGAGTGSVGICNGANTGLVQIGGDTNTVSIKSSGATGGTVYIADNVNGVDTYIGSRTSNGTVIIGGTANIISIKSNSAVPSLTGRVDIAVDANATAVSIGTGVISGPNITTGNITIGNTGNHAQAINIRCGRTNGIININSNETVNATVNTISISSTLLAGSTGITNIANDAAGMVTNISTGSTTGSVTIGSSNNTTNLNSDTINMPNVVGDTAAGGVTLLVGTGGVLGTVVSMRASKYDIIPFAEKYNSTDIIEVLQPQTYKFKSNNAESIGLIAEDVFPVLPELCPVDAEGAPISVRYDLLSVILLEELKKQKNKIAALETQIAELVARMK